MNAFFHFVNTQYFLGLPIDHYVHVIVCFTLFLVFRLGFCLKTHWCFVLIVLIGLGKVWFSWGAMIDSGRFENPVHKMFDNGLGAVLGYLVYRYRRKRSQRVS